MSRLKLLSRILSWFSAGTDSEVEDDLWSKFDDEPKGEVLPQLIRQDPPQSPPGFLFKYTSATGALAILQTGLLRWSEASVFNDPGDMQVPQFSWRHLVSEMHKQAASFEKGSLSWISWETRLRPAIDRRIIQAHLSWPGEF